MLRTRRGPESLFAVGRMSCAMAARPSRLRRERAMGVTAELRGFVLTHRTCGVLRGNRDRDTAGDYVRRVRARRSGADRGGTMAMSEGEVVLYDPTAEPRAIDARLAPRLEALHGKRVAILDNSKANAGTLMLAVAKRLQERHGVGPIVKREKPVAGPP